MDNQSVISYSFSLIEFINKLNEKRLILNEGFYFGEGLIKNTNQNYAFIAIKFEISRKNLANKLNNELLVEFNVSNDLKEFENKIIANLLLDDCKPFVLEVLKEFNMIFLANQNDYLIKRIYVENAKMHKFEHRNVFFTSVTWKAIANAFFQHEVFEF